MNVDNPYGDPGHEIHEQGQKQVNISEIDPENLNDIAEYYKFEVDNSFSKLREGGTIDGQAKFRQGQMENGQLKVFTAKEGEELIGTSVVVLENAPGGTETMEKDIQNNEAFAAGTFIAKDKRSGETALRLAQEQERAAREAGKSSIITDIDRNNPASMRFRMNKNDYVLEGVNDETDEAIKYSYRFRKKFDQESQSADWTEQVRSGSIQKFNGEFGEKEVLIDPDDGEVIKQALEKGYRGVSLLNPERDFGDEESIDKNYVVFTKE